MVDLKAIKRKLEAMRCPSCNENPTITIVGKDKFNISCCCDPFKRTLTQKAKDIMADQAKRSIEDQLRNIFK